MSGSEVGVDVGNVTAAFTLPQRVVIITAGTLLSLVTAGGNLLVLLSFRIDKSLQIISNYFLFSLAVADFAIGLISCPFMTLYTVRGEWPLGYGLCQFWLSVDYLMSNASVWNLLLISLDRYFSVTRPLTYRPKRTTKKALIMIASTYILSLVLWPPWIIAWPYIEGKFVIGETECMVQFLRTNPAVTISTIMAAFYIPVSVMVVLYARVFWVTETRNKQLAKLQGFQKKSHMRVSFRNAKNTAVKADSLALQEGDAERRRYRRRILCCRVSSRLKRSREDFGSSISCALEESQDSQLELSDDNLLTVNSCAEGAAFNGSNSKYETYTVVIQFPGKGSVSGTTTELTEPRISVYDPEETPPQTGVTESLLKKKRRNLPKGTSVDSACSSSPNQKSSRSINIAPAVGAATSGGNVFVKNKQVRPAGKGGKKSSDKKQERKAAKTLSAILLAFVLTWAPYSIIICITAFKQGVVPDEWFTFSYYLCYINSTINPILYALCNENFRRTYIRILKCQCSHRRQYKHQRGTSAFTK